MRNHDLRWVIYGTVKKINRTILKKKQKAKREC